MSLTKVTQSMVLGGSVSIREFGAVGDGVADDTQAVQAAIDYCLTYPNGQLPFLLADGKFRITAPLIINRPVDTTQNEFHIVGQGYFGGFYADSNIGYFFSSTIPHTTAPVSEQVTFVSVQFETNNKTLDLSAVDGNKFLRMKFDKCYFLRCGATSSSIYIQTYNFSLCQAREWDDWFVDALGFYDVHVNQCLFENASTGKGFSCFDPSNNKGAIGCSFTNNNFEGCFGPFLSLQTPYGVTVSGNYFEQNSTFNIDFSQGRTQGCVVSGNFFSAKASNIANPNFYEVSVGECFGFTGSGNFCDSRLYNFNSTTCVAFVGAGETPSVSLYGGIGNPTQVFTQTKTVNTVPILTQNGFLSSISFNGTTPVSTGVSVNAGSGGGCLLAIISFQTSNGNNTASAIYMIRFGYDGNNFTATKISGDDGALGSGWSNFSFTQSNGTLFIASSTGPGNGNVSFYGNNINTLL